MKKVAIFAEGLSEQIFIRHLLLQTMDCNKLSFKCLRLYADRMIHAPFEYNNPNAEFCFLIINVGQDEKVLSAIKEREENLITKGFDSIIGLRDMYSEEYCKRSPNGIDDSVTKAFIDGWNDTVRHMSDPSKIRMHIAIMELEAWFLALYEILRRVNSVLSVDYIEKELGFNLADIDPQTEFFHPTDVLTSILGLVEWQYDKSRDQVESICSQLNNNDLCDAFENGRCHNFRVFYEEMSN